MNYRLEDVVCESGGGRAMRVGGRPGRATVQTFMPGGGATRAFNRARG